MPTLYVLAKDLMHNDKIAYKGKFYRVYDVRKSASYSKIVLSKSSFFLIGAQEVKAMNNYVFAVYR